MPDTVSRLRELLARGTPRPWLPFVCPELDTHISANDDNELAAAAVNALPKLLNVVEAGTEWLQRHDAATTEALSASWYTSSDCAKSAAAAMEAAETFRAALASLETET
jgi:hypothetical protein